MSLRREDHVAVQAWLGQVERKGLPAPVFSAYGGSGYGAGNGSGGLFGGGGIFGSLQPGAKHDYHAEAGPLWLNSAIAICLGWRGDNLAEPEPVVEQRTDDDGWEILPDHPLTRLLRKPNPYYGWDTLIRAWDLSFTTDGNAFWMLAQGMDGMPLGIYPIPHFRIWPRWNSSGNQYVGWWDYQVDGRIIPLKPEAVVHFRNGIDPHQDRLGIAALKSNLREVCTDNQFASYTAALARNMGIIPYVISPSEANAVIEDDDLEAIDESFAAKTTGENRGKGLVSGRGLKVDRLGLSPEEMALGEITRVPEARIVAACKLNSQVVNLASGEGTKTYSNYPEARKAAYEDGLIPALKAMAWVINERLLPRMGDPRTQRFRFDFSRVAGLSEGEDAKALRWGDAYQKNKGCTLNEYRTNGLGLKSIGDAGDKFADGSTPEEGPQRPPAPIALPAPGHQAALPAPKAEPRDDEVKRLNDQAAEMLAMAREIVGGGE